LILSCPQEPEPYVSPVCSKLSLWGQRLENLVPSATCLPGLCSPEPPGCCFHTQVRLLWAVVPMGTQGAEDPRVFCTLLWRSAGLPEFRTDKHSLKVPTSTSPRQPGGSAVSRSASPWLYSVPRGTLHYVKAMLSPASENSSSSQSNGTQWSPWLCPRAPRWAPTQVVSFGCGLRAPGFKAGALKMAKTWQTQGRTGAPLTAKTVGTEETAQRH
jgi:hypothetical protein